MTCPDAVSAVLLSLQTESTGSLTPVSCPAPGVLVLSATVPTGPPLRLEVRPGDQGFRQAGAFSLSPIYDGDWTEAPAAWQTSLDAIAAAVGSRGGELGRALVGVPTVAAHGFLPESAPQAPPPPQTPWFPGLGVALLVLGAGIRGRQAGKPKDLAVGAALLLGALGLRLAFGSWGPLHPNGQGPMWLLGAWGKPEILGTYGPGYPQLFTWVARSFAVPDTAVFVANAVLGSLAAGCGALLVLALDGGRIRAWWLGCLLAAEPFMVWAGTSESYYPGILLCLLAGAAGFAAAARDDTPALGKGALVLGAALLLTHGLRTHPLCWPWVAAVPCVLLARNGPLVRNAAWALLSAAAIAAVIATASWGALRHTGSLLLAQYDTGLLSEGALPLPGPGFWFAAALWALAARAHGQRALGVALATIPMWAIYTTTSRVFFESVGWLGSYTGLAAALPLAVTALLIPGSWSPRLAPIPPLALLAAGLFALGEPPTEHAEYRWLRTELMQLGEGSRVAYVDRADLLTMTLPEHLVPGWSCGTTSGLPVRSEGDVTRGLDPGETRYYYRSSLCSTPQGEPFCAAAERGVALRELARARFPAKQTMSSLSYLDDQVEVVLFAVDP